jgi:DNA-binding transcriptional LysR family regulator
MQNLNHLAVFQAIAQASSFTGAAKVLGMDKAHLSRVLRSLEASLGTVLVTRTTRSVTLTAEGQQLLLQIAEPLRRLEVAAASMPDRPLAPSGEVALATTPDLGRTLLAPLLASFRARFPLVRLRLLLEQDVVGRCDIALRVGRQKTGSMKVRQVGALEAGFFAAPRYLSARGTPTTLDALQSHEGLWPLSKPGRRSFASERKPPPPAISCDDFVTLAALARAGCGVAVLPVFLARSDVENGSLQRVLPDVAFGGAPLFLVTPPERPLPPRVAVLRDFLVAEVPRAI